MYRLLFLFSFLAFFACKNGSKSATKPTKPTTEAPAESATLPNGKRKVKPPVLPVPTSEPIDLSKVAKPSASKMAYLTTNYWSCFGAQAPKDDRVAAEYRNMKLQFMPDMSFKAYRNKEFAFEGKWTFDDAKSQIFLSSTEKSFNTSFKTMDSGFRMVWIGNTEINGTGVQMRWDNHKNLED